MSDDPKPIKVQSSGEVTRRENKDGSLSLSSKHPVALHIDSIKSIGIENLVAVEVLQFEASNVDAFIANGESIILKRQRDDAKPSA